MPRVIAGSVGGRRFAVPKGRGTRPTTERVREALFSALAQELPDAAVLDLFAGSGALAIEALSRGAARAVLVESDRRAAAVAQRNLDQLGLDGGTVAVQDVRAFCMSPAGGPFDVVVADPPYHLPFAECAGAVADLLDRGGVAPGAPIVIQRRWDDAALSNPSRGRTDAGVNPDLLPPGVAGERVRTYGDTALIWWRAATDAGQPAAEEGGPL